MYALNIGEDMRILSATMDKYAPPEQPRVSTLPEGNISDYKYIDGDYVYDPLPAEDHPSETGGDIWDELAAAYTEGVASV